MIITAAPAGFAAGLFGIGGGLITVPILYYIFNNAGINRDNLSLRMKDDEWQKVIDINLSSTFLLSKYAIKKMLKRDSGRIINITSIVGHTGNIGQSNYAASKAGIIGISTGNGQPRREIAADDPR